MILKNRHLSTEFKDMGVMCAGWGSEKILWVCKSLRKEEGNGIPFSINWLSVIVAQYLRYQLTKKKKCLLANSSGITSPWSSWPVILVLWWGNIPWWNYMEKVLLTSWLAGNKKENGMEAPYPLLATPQWIDFSLQYLTFWVLATFKLYHSL